MVFDIAPVMIFETPLLDSPAEMLLKQYVFDTRSDKLVLCLGFGSLYNHSLKSRASCYYDENNNVMVFTALQKIPAHTEITINYNSEEAGTDRFPELNVD